METSYSESKRSTNNNKCLIKNRRTIMNSIVNKVIDYEDIYDNINDYEYPYNHVNRKNL